MNTAFQNHISNLLKEPIKRVQPVSGGDISQTHKITTTKNNYFLKTNKTVNAFSMFKAEALGLKYINNTKTIKTPKVLCHDTYQNTSFLLMEFIDSKPPTHNDFINLGLKLAELHKNTSETFGFEHHNFIGNLNQSNKTNKAWVMFYTNERLIPQLQLAKQSGLLSANECPSKDIITQNLEELFYNIKPSLLHGDLWSGNYLISTEGIPYLIDPAIYYGHHEVDIAMTKLFGGFGDSFYNAYQSIFPKDINTKARIEIYQLYYLLVHLNLFGRSYYSSVVSILKKYF